MFFAIQIFVIHFFYFVDWLLSLLYKNVSLYLCITLSFLDSYTFQQVQKVNTVVHKEN